MAHIPATQSAATPDQVAAAGQQAHQVLAAAGEVAPVDLVSMRAARWEAVGYKPIIWVHGQVDLVPELPIEVGDLLIQGKIRDAVALLLVDNSPEAVDLFMAGRPTVEDLDEITRLYGVEAGEAQPSPGS